MKIRVLLACVALSGFIFVALGAAVAHHFAGLLPTEHLEWMKTGLQYQAYHTLAILGVISLYRNNPMTCLWLSGLFWMLGIVLFSGSLYAFAFFPVKSLVYITPLGGGCFLIGWLLLLFASFRLK